MRITILFALFAFYCNVGFHSQSNIISQNCINKLKPQKYWHVKVSTSPFALKIILLEICLPSYILICIEDVVLCDIKDFEL